MFTWPPSLRNRIGKPGTHGSDNFAPVMYFTRPSDYTPIFGLWRFHEKIPMVRRLWEYRYYSESPFPSSNTFGSDPSCSDQWSDSIKRDYPLHRALRPTSHFPCPPNCRPRPKSRHTLVAKED
jgi:hypothetical protein